MSHIFRCFFGPRLYRLYKSSTRQGKDYEGNVLEYYSDGIVRTTLISMSLACSISLYASPLFAMFMYRRGYFSPEGFLSIYRLSSTFGVLLFLTMFIRGIGRMLNSDYGEFIAALDTYKKSKNISMKHLITQYDFDFKEWPVDFQCNESTYVRKQAKLFLNKASSANDSMYVVKSLPLDFISYFAIHSFGRMMIYPGSVGLLNTFLASMLLKGRSRLVEDLNGKRFKLLTEDGNQIDSMFLDRRNDSSLANGKTLVICCEGNAGFYEYGICGTPTEAGYSVLGWNHPGFGSSTGLPYPDQELNAVDAVMQFAISKLGFKEEDIVLYAWSIGGYTATWAAMNYQDIKGLVLDATFDDLVHLAIPRMPSSWKSLVVKTIRDHMDLNNAAQLSKYHGPVLLVRRTRDEIISTVASRSIQTNRGNDLLIRLLQERYPKLVDNDTLWVLEEWLSGGKNHQTVLWSEQAVDEDVCDTILQVYWSEHGFGFPLNLGENLTVDMKLQLVLYLADKHMMDFDSTHCIPLPSRVFRLPWGPKESDMPLASPKAHI